MKKPQIKTEYYDENYFKVYPEDGFRMIADNDELKSLEIDQEFYARLAISSGNTEYVRYQPKKIYSVEQTHINTDPFVRLALKEWDYEYYKTLDGWTKSPKLGIALTGLLQYSYPKHKKTNLYEYPGALDAYEEACYEAEQYFFGGSDYSEPITIDEAIDQLPTNTAAGYLHLGKQKHEVMEQARQNAKVMYRNITSGRGHAKIPSTFGLRGHLSPKEKNKSRLVWIFPYETVILECSLFKNLYYKIRGKENFLHGRSTMSRLYQYLNKRPDLKQINTDVSSWDRLRAEFLIHKAFEIFRKYLRLTEEEERLFEWVKMNFINTEFALPNGLVLRTKSGIKSGSYLTLMINSICNYISQKTALKLMGIEVIDESVVGDDFSFLTHMGTFFDTEKYEFLNMHLFCHKMNAEKQVISYKIQDRKFIGYKFDGPLLVRPQQEWFLNALYPERRVDNIFVSFSRLFSYLTIGGINDLKFTDFFERFIGYFSHLLDNDQPIFDTRVLKAGKLRVFKHVLDVNLNYFEGMTFKSFLRLDWYKIRFMFAYDLDISKCIKFDFY